VSRFAIATWSDPSYVDPEPPMIAEELRRRGHEAQVVVWYEERDWTPFDLVVVRSTWDYFDRLEEFLDWVDLVDRDSRIINSPSVIRWNAHKGYLAELGAKGVRVLPSLSLPQGGADAAERMRATGWGEVVIKPAVDGGARMALKADAGDARAAEHLSRLVESGDAIVQPYAPGVEQGEVSMFFFGGELSHAVRKVPRAGDYRVQAMHGGAEMHHEPSEAEIDLARSAMALAPDRLAYARVDCIDVDGEPTLMELELVEPDLLLRMSPGSHERFVDAVLAID
jgi:glutathione synthase/RimK-type ligase-like ATP-grasp enzyme